MIVNSWDYNEPQPQGSLGRIQFDWSEEGLVRGTYYQMQTAQFNLCASRALWLLAYPSQGHER
jgi:hypothetical protein